MLKLLPTTAAAKIVQAINTTIQQALPEDMLHNPTASSNLFAMIMGGKAQCWIECDEDKEDTSKLTIKGVCITAISIDELSLTRDLLIYAICSFVPEKLPQQLYSEAIGVLKSYAVSNDCDRIICYVKHDDSNLINIIQSNGGKLGYVMCAFPLN